MDIRGIRSSPDGGVYLVVRRDGLSAPVDLVGRGTLFPLSTQSVLASYRRCYNVLTALLESILEPRELGLDLLHRPQDPSIWPELLSCHDFFDVDEFADIDVGFVRDIVICGVQVDGAAWPVDSSHELLKSVAEGGFARAWRADGNENCAHDCRILGRFSDSEHVWRISSQDITSPSPEQLIVKLKEAIAWRECSMSCRSPARLAEVRLPSEVGRLDSRYA